MRFFGTLIGGLLAIAVFWVYLRFYPQGGHSMLLALLLGAAIVVLILLCRYFWPGRVQLGVSSQSGVFHHLQVGQTVGIPGPFNSFICAAVTMRCFMLAPSFKRYYFIIL